MAGNSYVFRSGVFNKTDKSAEVLTGKKDYKYDSSYIYPAPDG